MRSSAAATSRIRLSSPEIAVEDLGRITGLSMAVAPRIETTGGLFVARVP